MKKLNKLMAALLALVMCLSLMPMSVFAEEADPVNPYQEQIGTANDVKDTATETKPTLDGLGGATNSGIYSNIENTANGAVSKADEANTTAEDVTKALEAAQKAVDKVIGEQQQKVDDEHAEDKGVIDSKASEITTKTQEIVTAVGEANKQVEAVNNSLKELETADLSPEEKVAAAEEIQAAADQAKAVADNAKKVADDANAEMEAAVAAANKAKADYDAFVLAAQGEVDKAKLAEFEAKLSDAETKLNAAETKAQEAAAAKAAADLAKDAADKSLAAAQSALTTAQETLNGINWPEGVNKDNVDSVISDKTQEATEAGKAADEAQIKSDKLDKEITDLNQQKTEKSSELTGKKGDKGTLETQKGINETARDEYNQTVTGAENQYNKDLEGAKQAFLNNIKETYGEVIDKNGDWAQNDVALFDYTDASGVNHYKDHLIYEGKRVKNSEFAFYIKVCELDHGTNSEEYERLTTYYAQWKKELGENSSYSKLNNVCEEKVGTVAEKITEAQTTRDDTVNGAMKTLKDKTDCDNISAVDEKITELGDAISELDTQIEKLEQAISDLGTNIGNKTTEKNGYDTTVTNKTAEKLAAEKAAADLSALKEAVAAAQTALNNAKVAEETANTKKTLAEEALSSYEDAQANVKKAQEELQAGLKGQLSAKTLEELEAELEAAQTAALNAKKAYDDAKKDADDAQKTADKAKEDADKAKEDADRELADFNNRYDGGDDTGDTGVTIEDELVPLASGPVTRAQFVDYLWRHEGEPASDGVCTFADVAEDHEYVLALAWAEDNGIAVADAEGNFEPDELVTTQAVKDILDNFANVFGTNAVAVSALTTLAGADDEAVLNCDQVLAEFFGEEYVVPEDLDSLETDTAA